MFSWSKLIALLIQFFAPYLKDLLDDLLNRAKPPGDLAALDPPAAVEQLFQAARAQTWFWQFGKRAKLAACQRIATARAGEFFQAMHGTATAPKLSLHDSVELTKVL